MPKKNKSKKISSKENSSNKNLGNNIEDFDEDDDASENDFDEDEFDESNETDDFESPDDSFEEKEPGIIQRTKIRSRGLFNNPWWKKGALKGAIVWLLFVVFFYLMDFVGLVEVIDARRWGFFLLLLMILGMAWEKILYKFIKV